jgi:hypothetical protein
LNISTAAIFERNFHNLHDFTHATNNKGTAPTRGKRMPSTGW